jgi:hypothetical protein
MRVSGLVIHLRPCFVFEPASTSSLTSEQTLWLAEGIFPDDPAALWDSVHSVPLPTEHWKSRHIDVLHRITELEQKVE